MCGIMGIVDFARAEAHDPWNPPELSDAEQLRDGMQHRGPDGAGLWQTPGVILGHRRLAILDLSPTGHQPMLGPDQSVLTFNGEIYNYLELRQDLLKAGCTFQSTGDTEVLLQALVTWGVPQTLARARGMYAFAWWQPRTQTLWLARDPVGKKPLYFWRHGPRLAFASSLWPLMRWLQTQRVQLDVDPIAIEHFLAGGYIPAPRTAFVQVHKLQAGQFLQLDLAGTTAHHHHPPPFTQQPQKLQAKTLENLDALLEQAVARRLRSDVPVATFLSGGLDSSLVTAVAARLHPGITAYTVRTGDGNDDELKIAARVAKHVGVRQEVIDIGQGDLELLPQLVQHYGEPFGDSSALPTWRVSEAAGHKHRVVLTGDGGDEVQGGYPRSQLFALRHLLHDQLHVPTLPMPRENLPLPNRKSLLGKLDSTWFRAFRLLTPGPNAVSAQHDGYHHLHHVFAPHLHKDLRLHGWQALVQQRFLHQKAHSELDRALGLEFTLYLPEDLCVKVDVASMAHAVETRAPLLDVDFTDASWQIAPEDRVRPRQTKRIIRQLLERRVPADCVLKGKRGFSVPMSRWLETPEMRGLLDARLRAGMPGMEFLDGHALAAELEMRRRTGREAGTLRFRLLWLAKWGELVNS